MTDRYELRTGYNWRNEPRWYVFDRTTGLCVRQFANRVEAEHAFSAFAA